MLWPSRPGWWPTCSPPTPHHHQTGSGPVHGEQSYPPQCYSHQRYSLLHSTLYRIESCGEWWVSQVTRPAVINSWDWENTCDCKYENKENIHNVIQFSMAWEIGIMWKKMPDYLSSTSSDGSTESERERKAYPIHLRIPRFNHSNSGSSTDGSKTVQVTYLSKKTTRGIFKKKEKEMFGGSYERWGCVLEQWLTITDQFLWCCN